MFSPVVKEMDVHRKDHSKKFTFSIRNCSRANNYMAADRWACPSQKEGDKLQAYQAFVLRMRNNYDFGRASNHRAQDKGRS